MSKFAATLYGLGGFLALLSVALSALAVHALVDIAPTGAQAVIWFREATAFQMNHALGLIFVTMVAEHLAEGRARRLMRIAAALLLAAAILFPAALYSVSFQGPVFFAPFGGVAAMAGWLLFAVSAWLAWREREGSGENG